MDGKGACGSMQSIVDELSLIFRRSISGPTRWSPPGFHAERHLIHAIRAITGRTSQGVA